MAEFIGKVVSRTATTNVGSKQTPTFDFMLEELNPKNSEFPSRCVLKLYGSKVDELKSLITPDRVVKATFDYNGRKYQDKLYGENRCWKVEEVSQEQPAVIAEPAPIVPTANPVPQPSSQPTQEQGVASDTDLPF